jgi:hypothetical protein
VPRSIQQIATALRKAAKEDETTAGGWEAHVHAALDSCKQLEPRLQHGDGLVWLNNK